MTAHNTIRCPMSRIFGLLLGAVLLLYVAGHPALAQTATNLICNACVGASDIANGAVRSGEIANSTIVSADIKDGSIKAQDLANNSVTGPKILNNSVSSADLAPALNLGTPGNDGDFTVKQAAGPVGVRLNGDNSTVTNRYSSAPNQSNGLVKAWARIRFDGSVESCWRCNTNNVFTKRTAVGFYFVDFTPLATDVSGRPRSVVADIHEGIGSASVWFTVAPDTFDPSRINVIAVNSNASFEDQSFTLLIY